MHRQRIIAQISLVLSILNLVLAAPIVVRDIHEARGDVPVVPASAEDLEAMPEKLESAAASSRTSQDGIASTPHSSSAFPTPQVSGELSNKHEDYSWLLERPARQSLHDPLPSSHNPPTSSEPADLYPPNPESGQTSGTYSLAETAPRYSLSSISDVPSLPPSETPVTHPRVLTKSLMKKVGIVTGVTVLGGIIIGLIANSQINNHRDYQDQDS